MNTDVMRHNGFKTVQYHSNANKDTSKFDKAPVVGFNNHLRFPLVDKVQQTEIVKEKKPSLQTTEKKQTDDKVQQTEIVKEKKPSPQTTEKNQTDKSVDSKDEKPVKNVDAVKPTDIIKPDISEMPEVSFVPQTWSRDLILFENKKPVISKTYYFNYKGDNFPGIITDSQGKIFIYDRANEFHRPLQHLERTGDVFSGYHAGFQEIHGKKKVDHYIDLGTLEVLQAALQSSVSGKYNVAIHDDDSFMTNWMRATSPNETERLRYWNDNVSKLNSKTRKNLDFLLYAGIAGAVIVPTALLAVSVANNGDISPQDKHSNAQDTNTSDAGQKVMIGLLPAVGAAGLGVIGANIYHQNKKDLYSNENKDFKILDGGHSDTLVSKI